MPKFRMLSFTLLSAILVILLGVTTTSAEISLPFDGKFDIQLEKAKTLVPESDTRPLYNLFLRASDSSFDRLAIAQNILEARISSNKHLLAYASEGGKLFLYYTCGQETKQLADNFSAGLILSPAGKSLAYTGRLDASSAGQSDETRIFVADFESFSVQMLDTGLETADRPFFSPDGQVLFFVKITSGIPGIWSFHLADKRLTQLTNQGLKAGEGRPEGFIAPPMNTQDIRFDKQSLIYQSAEGEIKISLDGVIRL